MKSFLRSTIFLFFLALVGCASQPEVVPTLPSTTESMHTADGLVQRFGKLTGPEIAEFFSYLENRLSQAIPKRNRRNFSLTLLATNEPIALSVGSGYILISRGLILTLANEAELAFVISHEMSHEILMHHGLASADGLTTYYSTDLELAADRYALGVMALAGYDPRLAHSAISRLVHDRQATDQRLAQISEQIIISGWAPPGTVNRRDFKVLTSILQQDL